MSIINNQLSLSKILWLQSEYLSIQVRKALIAQLHQKRRARINANSSAISEIANLLCVVKDKSESLLQTKKSILKHVLPRFIPRE